MRLPQSRFQFKSIFPYFVILLLGILECSCAKRYSNRLQNGGKLSQEFQKPMKYNNSEITEWKNNREGRFFFVNFPNDVCTSDSGNQGVCMKTKSCTKQGGISSGTCAQGFGACCIISKACTSDTLTIDTNGTLLTQGVNSGGFQDACRYEIPKQLGVCQIRLDFNDFNIDEGPNAADLGQCSTDTMVITGNTNGMLGPLCGNLVGQHMYLDYAASGSINLDIYLASPMQQTWSILVTMIKCDSPDRAPDGCLQYFTAQRGMVQSFNNNLNQHQLNDQDYSVCVRNNPGMKKITWKTCTTNINDFFISGGMPAMCIPGISPPGCVPIGEPESGTNCTTDWVMVFGADKYCGSGFPDSVSSSTQPFMLQVHFDHWELPVPVDLQPPDDSNTGFCLMYAQSPF